MIDQAMTFLDWFGVIVFATTGSLAAARKRMDLLGFILLGGLPPEKWSSLE
jgi:uncharacterized membrane protein YeiH